jgi:hypothetical protein
MKNGRSHHTTFLQTLWRPVPQDIMPMSIHELGNSSAATVPTLFDLLIRGEIKIKYREGRHFLSVGSRNERKCFYLQILKKNHIIFKTSPLFNDRTSFYKK